MPVIGKFKMRTYKVRTMKKSGTKDHEAPKMKRLRAKKLGMGERKKRQPAKRNDKTCDAL